MLVCAYVCLSVVSRAAWEGDLASIRLGLIWAVPLLSVQGLQRTELQTGGTWGWPVSVSFHLIWGLPVKELVLFPP